MDRLSSTPKTPRARTAGLLVTLLLCAVGLTLAQRAEAQDAPAAPPAAEPAPVASPAPAPVETVPAEPAPVLAPTPEAPPPPVEVVPVAEEAPPVEEEAPKPLSIGVWAHLGTYLDGPGDKLNRVTADGEVDLLFSADLIEGFGMTANFVGVYGNGLQNGDIQIMDLHGKIGIDDAFNIWIGRMLVPSDRQNFSGYWFAAPWSYPAFAGPKQGPFGRNNGVTAWGQFAGGMFKYYAGAYDLVETSGGTLFSGRLNLALINPEPGYYHSSTYYGGKDILAIGVAGQFKKDASIERDAMGDPTGEVDDYSGFNADVLFEKNFGSGGVLDLEGAVYAYMGDFEGNEMSYFVLASWMTPEKIGIGKIQPLVRLQQQKPKADGADTNTLADFQLGYIIDNYATRMALGYEYSKIASEDGHKIFLGLQLQK